MPAPVSRPPRSLGSSGLQLLDKRFDGKCQLSACYAGLIGLGRKLNELIRIKTAALIAAVKLNIFTMIDEETVSVGDLVSRTGASRRGLRILCDYPTVVGLLKKTKFALPADPCCSNIS